MCIFAKMEFFLRRMLFNTSRTSHEETERPMCGAMRPNKSLERTREG